LNKTLHMKTIFSILFFSFCIAFNTSAQQTSNSKISIESDFDIDFVLDAHIDKNINSDLGKGYRIQIANSSSREDVFSKKAEVYEYFSDFKGYIVYDQPYYKLRIGDFQTRLEARKYLDEIIAIFPTAFIVSDEIRIKQ